MNRNLGGFDRVLRIVVGVMLAVASIGTVYFAPSASVVTGAVAAVLLLLAVVLLGAAGSYKCPVNALLGRNTYER
jgi:amino acid transporter